MAARKKAASRRAALALKRSGKQLTTREAKLIEKSLPKSTKKKKKR